MADTASACSSDFLATIAPLLEVKRPLLRETERTIRVERTDRRLRMFFTKRTQFILYFPTLIWVRLKFRRESLTCLEPKPSPERRGMGARVDRCAPSLSRLPSAGDGTLARPCKGLPRGSPTRRLLAPSAPRRRRSRWWWVKESGATLR